MASHNALPVATTTGGTLHNPLSDHAALAQFLQQAGLSRPTLPQAQQQSQPDGALIANIGALLSNLSQGGNNIPMSNGPAPLAPIHSLIPQSLAMSGQPGSSTSAAYISTLLQQLCQRPANQPAVTVPIQAPVPSTTLDTLAGTLPDDEAILVNTLSTRRLKGRNVREALEGLHGVCCALFRLCVLY